MLLCASCQHFSVLDLPFSGPGNILEKSYKSMKEKFAHQNQDALRPDAKGQRRRLRRPGKRALLRLDFFRVTMIIFICVSGGIYKGERGNSLRRGTKSRLFRPAPEAARSSLRSAEIPPLRPSYGTDLLPLGKTVHQENRWKNTKTGEEGRHHVHETILHTTMIYSHVLNKGGHGVRSLVDRL